MLKLECNECKLKRQEIYNCLHCNIKTCSIECLIKHKRKTHLTPQEKQTILTSNSLNNKIILLMNEGEYIKEIKPHTKLYDFINFEFKKQNVLGKGAYGDVYYSRNKINNINYAIKQINKDRLIMQGGTIDLAINEINIHRRLIHKHIVKLHTYHEDKDNMFLIMDYYPNGNLFQKLKLNQCFDEKTAFHYFIQTCSAINFLHSNNLVHRDLKPENLLLDSNNNIKLCDFGWCTEVSLGNRITFCGTYEYMAPEIVNELPYNCSIDIWSLGVLLYELLHGYSPFKAKSNIGESYKEIFENIKENHLTIDKKISYSCANLIKKLLNHDFNKRIKLKEIFTHPWVTSLMNGEHISNEIRESARINRKSIVTIKIKKEQKKCEKDSLEEEVLDEIKTRNEILIDRKESSNFFERVLKKLNDKKKVCREELKNENFKSSEIISNNNQSKNEIPKKKFLTEAINFLDVKDKYAQEVNVIRKKTKAKTLCQNKTELKTYLNKPQNKTSKSIMAISFNKMNSSNSNDSTSNTKYLKVDLFNPDLSGNDKHLQLSFKKEEKNNFLTQKKEISHEDTSTKIHNNFPRINSRQISLVKKQYADKSPNKIIINSLYNSKSIVEIRSKSHDKCIMKNNLLKMELINNALDILEKSENIDCVNVTNLEKEKHDSVWTKISNFFNPFKCGGVN